MIKNVNALGTYMILAPKVAMPHAQIDDSVRQTGFSMVILKNPVPFGKERIPVQIFVVLAAVDKKKHTQALKDLMFLLEHKSGISSLLRASSKKAVVEILKNITLN